MAAYYDFRMLPAGAAATLPPEEAPWSLVTSSRVPRLAELMLFDAASLAGMSDDAPRSDLVCGRGVADARFARRLGEAQAALAKLAVSSTELVRFGRFIAAVDASHVRYDLGEPLMYLATAEIEAFQQELAIVLATLDRPSIDPAWAERVLPFCGVTGPSAPLCGTVLGDSRFARLLLTHVPECARGAHVS